MIWLDKKIESFLAERGYKENTLKKYVQMLTHLARYERAKSVPVYEFPSNLMHDAFVSISHNYNTRQLLRSIILYYFDWLDRKGINTSRGRASIEIITDEILARDLERNYFFSVEELVLKLKLDVKKLAKEEFKRPEDYRFEMSAIILSWYGFMLRDMPHILKADLNIEDVVFKREIGIKISHKAWLILKEFTDAQSYTSRVHNGYAKTLYPSSDYLFRTTESPQIDSKLISNYVSKFNVKLGRNSERYKLDCILWSGRFYRAYQMMESNPKMFEGDLEDKVDLFSAIFEYKFHNKTQFRERLNEFQLYLTNLNRK